MVDVDRAVYVQVCIRIPKETKSIGHYYCVADINNILTVNVPLISARLKGFIALSATK